MGNSTTSTEPPAQIAHRWRLLRSVQQWLEIPLLILAFVWLVLMVVELVWGLNPWLENAGFIIWGFFIFDFVLGIALAPNKTTYLKRNWLNALALLAPALRIFRIAKMLRIARVARATRGLRLVRVLGTINRGTRAFTRSMSRRGFGYVVGITIIVVLVGAAGMFAFENQTATGGGLDSYGTALWWTAMIMTTMGSDYWPQTAEGRLLCFLLSLYAFAVFGYVTATLASFFIEHTQGGEETSNGAKNSLARVQAEISALRREIREMAQGKSP